MTNWTNGGPNVADGGSVIGQALERSEALLHKAAESSNSQPRQSARPSSATSGDPSVAPLYQVSAQV